MSIVQPNSLFNIIKHWATFLMLIVHSHLYYLRGCKYQMRGNAQPDAQPVGPKYTELSLPLQECP